MYLASSAPKRFACTRSGSPWKSPSKKGFLDLALVALLSSAEARDALVPTDDVEDTQPKKRIKKPAVSCQPAARAEAKGKAKAKAIVAAETSKENNQEALTWGSGQYMNLLRL